MLGTTTRRPRALVLAEIRDKRRQAGRVMSNDPRYAILHGQINRLLTELEGRTRIRNY